MKLIARRGLTAASAALIAGAGLAMAPPLASASPVADFNLSQPIYFNIDRHISNLSELGIDIHPNVVDEMLRTQMLLTNFARATDTATNALKIVASR